MNIRNYIPNDHIMSVNETTKWQAQMIQLLTIEINDKDKQINELQEQLEAYENMRKEAIKYCKSNLELWNIVPIKSNDVKAFIEVHNNYLNILNKVGEDNDTR